MTEKINFVCTKVWSWISSYRFWRSHGFSKFDKDFEKTVNMHRNDEIWYVSKNNKWSWLIRFNLINILLKYH